VNFFREISMKKKASKLFMKFYIPKMWTYSIALTAMKHLRTIQYGKDKANGATHVFDVSFRMQTYFRRLQQNTIEIRLMSSTIFYKPFYAFDRFKLRDVYFSL
jgi:hypothetical protein